MQLKNNAHHGVGYSRAAVNLLNVGLSVITKRLGVSAIGYLLSDYNHVSIR